MNKHKPNRHDWVYEWRLSGRYCRTCECYQLRTNRKWETVPWEVFRDQLNSALNSSIRMYTDGVLK